MILPSMSNSCSVYSISSTNYLLIEQFVLKVAKSDSSVHRASLALTCGNRLKNICEDFTLKIVTFDATNKPD